MTAKKAAAKKPAANKQAEATAADSDATPVTEAAAPEMEGEAYQQGFHGVSSDDEDYSVAAQVAKLEQE